MSAVLWLLVALQSDPLVEKVERLTGDVNRPLLWTPLKITVSSAAGFSGDLCARSEFGFQTVKSIQLAPGGKATIILPALDAKEVAAGKAVRKMARDFVRPERVVLVDTSLPYAAELVSSPETLYQKINPEDLQATRSRGLLEVADLILTKERAATREDAEKAVAALGEPSARLEAVDRTLWPLAPEEGWVPPKRVWALYFAAVYAFSAFVGLAVVARRLPKFGLACVGGVAFLGMAGYALVFPRHQVWVVSDRVREVGPTGETREHRVWFVNAAAEVETAIAFPRLVKPIFPTSAGTDDPFTLRVDERGCRVEGLRLGPNRSACFGGTESVGVTKPDLERLPKALSAAVLIRRGRARYLGDLPAGAAIPATPEGENPVHRSADFDAWSRFVGPDGLFGVLDRDARSSHDLDGPDLADERERTRSLILRLR
ncbi:MAG TPA: hypothetical protein VKU80_01925 [Planctomycetota bacterium]|nr:hypothetical protein [Planctomycetota bacterium]